MNDTRLQSEFEALTEALRGELQVHCYRIVGSVQDAEDLVQETLVAAWRGLDGFEGRASLQFVAVPDRDQPLPESPARPRAAAAAAPGARRADPAPAGAFAHA